MHHYECPVCEGWETSSRSGNVSGHIKRHAAYELLHRYLFGEQTVIPHAEWLKANAKTTMKTQIDLSFKGK